MNYTKPEVLLLGRTVDAVQSNEKQGDNLDSETTRTIAAYEADE
jgi:hypothetical protein